MIKFVIEKLCLSAVLLNAPISQGLDVQLNASQVIINHFKVAQLISFHTQRKPTHIQHAR